MQKRKMIRSFNYSEEMLPYVKKVLEESGHKYEVRNEKIRVRMSGREFHKVVILARCKKQEAEYKIPHGVLPYEKWLDSNERAKKRNEFNGMPAELLDSDKWKLDKAIKEGLL